MYKPRYFKKSKRPVGGYGGAERRKESSHGHLESLIDYEDEDDGGAVIGGMPSLPMPKRSFRVSSKGDINATFSVPGLITIPSDGVSHNVTISELDLDAGMSWVSVPKKSPKAHLTVYSICYHSHL